MNCAIDDVVEEVLSSQNERRGDVRRRLKNYLSMLASTGKTEGELKACAKAYLKEFREPDSRYSGC
jgi:hypothetical protein